MKLFQWAVAAAVILTQSVPDAPLLADETTDSINSLKQKIEQLDQKLRILERNRELEKEAAETKAKEAPKISVGEKGFSFGSSDGNFAINLKGVLQADSRTFFKDGGIKGNDGFLLRRARPIISGTVFGDFDFLFVPDFGGTSGTVIQDAYLNYRYKPELQFQFGKFKSPVGLELLQSDPDTSFNERALPTDLVPNRDIGAKLHGDLFDGRASYAAGIFNGLGDARNSNNADFEDDKEFAGRLFLQPLKKSGAPVVQGLAFGVGGSYGNSSTANALPATTGGTAPGYFTDGQQQFFAYRNSVVASGKHWRISPQGSYYYGPFGLLGEYVISSQQVQTNTLTTAALDNTAWQITGSWVLTGEDASYKGVVPAKRFDPSSGHWGAFQLVARYAHLAIDRDAFPQFADPATSANSASAWSAGLNWYLNRNVLVKTSFSRTTFSGGGGAGVGAPAIVTRQPENVLFTRVQLAF
ncbi:MAG: porin [Verrucomicrobia bacterium]|nr:MAG: porin [Verrucomicrobiota bacterium]